MKRRFTGVLLAGAMLLPAGVIGTATPAAAAGGTVCKTASGTATFTPALPKASSPTKNKPTVKIAGAKVGGCVGGGVTAGTLSATLKFSIASNCLTLAQGKSGGVSGPLKIVWAGGKGTSTIAKATLKGVTGKPTTQNVAGKITLGTFKGSSLKATTIYTIKAPQCGTAGLSKVTFKLVAGTKLVIK
jgi:hypothetical protein